MNLGDIATKARALTNTDVNSYLDANLLIDINIVYQKVADMIFESQDNSDFDDARRTDYPIQTTLMIANQRDYTMAVSEGMLKLKRVDVCYDGINSYRADPFDTGTLVQGIFFNSTTPVDANFDGNFVKQNPRYDYSYNALWIAPMPVAVDVSAGGFIRTEWERNVIPFATSDYTSVLTDSTAVPGFDAPFHVILAYGAAYEYAKSRQLPQLTQLATDLADYEGRIRNAYGRKNLDFELALKTIYNDNYGR